MYTLQYVFLSILSITMAANILLDPISMERPPFEPITHSFKPLFPVTQPGPIQTNKFWLNFITSTIDDPVHSHPYVFRLEKQNFPFGLAIACDFKDKVLLTSPARIELELEGSEEFYVNMLNNDIIFSSTELNANTERNIIYHDIFGCHLRMGSVTSNIVFPIFRGMAYVSAEYTQMTPALFTVGFFKSVNGKNYGVVTGNKFKIELGNGQIWILYSDKSITFNVDPNSIKSIALFTGTLKLARIPKDNAALAESIFDSYSGKYIVGGDLDLESTGDQYKYNYIFNWKSKGNGALLHFAFPHHVDTMVTAVKTDLKMWSTVKGEMVGYVGDSWKLFENGLTDIGFLPKGAPDAAYVPKIKDQIIKDINDFDIYPATVSASNYFGGKGLAKLSNLCLLGKELNIPTDSYQKCMNKAKLAIQPYLDNKNMNYFVYDIVWKGIIGNNGLNCTNLNIICSGMDFGASYYNDHHYHYGYLIYAAAVLAQLDPQFGQTNKVWVENLIRDVGNPSKLDPYFPVFRSFDWFAGHSYSQGIFASADGKDQESTSEEINYHYSVMLWGMATNNPRFKTIGNIMYALNKRSIQRYFLMKSDNTVHPAKFINNKVTGINFENKVHYTTWFGFNTEYIHGIQMIPYLPVTDEVRDFEFVSEEWETRLKNLNLPDSAAWKSLLYLSYATVNKAAAWNALQTTAVDDGLTRSWALYSIASRSKVTDKTPAPTPFNSIYLNFIKGTQMDWDFSNFNSYQHISTAGLSAITLKNSLNSASDYYVVSEFTKLADNSQMGLVLNYKTTTNYGKQWVYVKYSNDGNLYFCIQYLDLNLQNCQSVGKPVWNVGEKKVMKVRNTITGTNNYYYTIYLDNIKYTTFVLSTSWANGDNGIIADKGVKISNMFVSNPTNVKATVTDCSMSDNDIIRSIANALNIAPENVVGLQRFGCSKKKDILSAESISFNIVGSTYTSSSMLANKLKENPPSNFENIEFSIQDTTADLNGVTPVSMSLVPPSTLGPVEIACIAVAAAVVATGIIVGTILLIKKKTKPTKETTDLEDNKSNTQSNKENDAKSSSQEENPDSPKDNKPRGSTINVYNLDPKNITSITARKNY